MVELSKFRFKLFFSHLICSCTVAAITAAIVFLVWHPAPLAKAVGVTHIFLLMLAIDAILGPVLTWTVAKEGKARHLIRLDMTVIVICQLAAISYGLYSIAVNRPVYMVFDKIRFDLVQAGDIKDEELAQAQAPYNTTNWGTPKWAAVRPFKDDKERSDLLNRELRGDGAPSTIPFMYESIDSPAQWELILKEAQGVADLSKYNPESAVSTVLQSHPQADRFLPMKAYDTDMTVLIDSKNKQIVDVVDLRPWQ